MVNALSVISSSSAFWQRAGGAAEISSATLEFWDGSNWVQVADGTRATGGWSFDNLSLPTNGQLRARARVASGQYNGSSMQVAERSL